MLRGAVALMACAGCGRIGFEVATDATTSGDAITCRGLDASWTPEWSELIEYEPFDGANAIGDGAAIPAIVGGDGTASNLDQTGMTYVPGKIAQAISFDGVDDTLTVPLPTIDTDDSHVVSVALWMQWNGVLYAPGGTWTKVVLFDAPEYALTFVGPMPGTSALGYNTGSGDLWGVDGAGLANRWVHVVAEFVNGDTSLSSLYIDGQPQTMSFVSGAASNSHVSTTLMVAALPSYPSYYTGALDELAVWNVGLTPAEVVTLYEACP